MMKPIPRRKVCRFLAHRGIQLIVGITSYSLLSCQAGKSLISDNDAIEAKILSESGDFLDEVNRLKKLALPANSRLYQPPTFNELKSFKLLAKDLLSQNLNEVLNRANSLNYELIKFIDTTTKQVFYGLREKLKPGLPIRGWGSYFINFSYQANALLEIPHILFDEFSEDIGAQVFLISVSRGLLIAGAHRNANGINTADVCNPINSIFQVVHKTWVSPNTKTWQIHGFGHATKLSFPNNTMSVLSNGQGVVTNEILDLSQRMKIRNFQAYTYNNLLPSNQINQQANQGIAGTTFLPLAATHNIQGKYSHKIGAAFTHIELDESSRFNAQNRDEVAKIIAESIQSLAK
jgi:hypothetical protein